VVRSTEEEMVMVGIRNINTEVPAIATCIDRAIEIIYLYKPAVLVVAHYPAQIIITKIEQIVVAVHSPLFTSQHIVHQIANGVNKVIVNFVCIVPLPNTEVEFVRHFIGQETSFLAYFAFAHGGHTCATHGSHPDGK